MGKSLVVGRPYGIKGRASDKAAKARQRRGGRGKRSGNLPDHSKGNATDKARFKGGDDEHGATGYIPAAMTDAPKTRPQFTRREPTAAEAEQHVAAVWECPASAFEDPRDAQPVPIPAELNGAPLSAADRALLETLNSRERSIILSVVRNNPAVPIAKALEHCRAFGM
jgi:hypothetical protein